MLPRQTFGALRYPESKSSRCVLSISNADRLIRFFSEDRMMPSSLYYDMFTPCVTNLFNTDPIETEKKNAQILSKQWNYLLYYFSTKITAVTRTYESVPCAYHYYIYLF